MSKVAFVKVKHEKNGVQKAVRKAMNLTHWKRFIKGKNIFVKINGISDQLVPGQCTSPWVIEAVLSELKKEFPNANIKIGDADLAATKQLNRAAKLWGFIDLAENFDAKFVNISDEPMRKVSVDGKILKEFYISKSVEEADTIINLPVAKTHCLTLLTCCLKNHWGLIPRDVRHNYHTVADQVIADINHYFKKTTFNVVDATVSMEGDAPRTGTPKVTDVVLAGHDRVAVDTVVAKFMGFNPDEIHHIKNSEKMNVGEMKYELVGDEFFVTHFKRGRPNIQPIFLLEMNLRKVPILNWLIFKTKLFDFFAWGATQYNVNVWYPFIGKKFAEKIIYKTWYGNEFKELWERTNRTGKLIEES